jgi:hypothetical protein
VLEPIPEFATLRTPLDQGQIDGLNRFLFQARRLLAGRLSVANQRAQWIDTVIQWPNTEAPKIRTNPLLSSRPRSVTLAEARIGTISTTPATIASTLEWDFSSGYIVLPQFYEPTNTTRWQLRLLVMED